MPSCVQKGGAHDTTLSAFAERELDEPMPYLRPPATLKLIPAGSMHCGWRGYPRFGHGAGPRCRRGAVGKGWTPPPDDLGHWRASFMTTAVPGPGRGLERNGPPRGPTRRAATSASAPPPGSAAATWAMLPSEPKEPTRSDATETSRPGELNNTTRGYAQIEADRESACTRPEWRPRTASRPGTPRTVKVRGRPHGQGSTQRRRETLLNRKVGRCPRTLAGLRPSKNPPRSDG